MIGALKRGLAPLSGELGLHVCGGRGKQSRRTPDELVAIGDRVGLDGAALALTSRLVAKVDSAAVQDGFDLYLHGFIVADDGQWGGVQQGMNGEARQARRYHWSSEGLGSFVDAPHAAIEGRVGGEIVNLTDRRAAASRDAQLDLLRDLGPDRIVREAAALEPPKPAAKDDQPMLPHLVLPGHHDVRPADVMIRRLHGTLAAAAENGPADFPELLLVPGVGARTVRSLAMVAEVIHGAPCRFADPARFSLAHGGKDRHPYPVPIKVFDRTIAVMKDAVGKAKLGNEEKLAAIRRLDAQARAMERHATGPTLPDFVVEEFRNSHDYGGRSVFGWEPPVAGERAAGSF
ncbi:Mlr6856 protein [hydrothermal vent metagenome]|uniref:Mlr6856 protein n=1 Tax=hydrothermal vent metagenome TaxID=652676 RepID=A0A161KFQ7_9ZZZZ